jgi:hypothetical protein
VGCSELNKGKSRVNLGTLIGQVGGTTLLTPSRRAKERLYNNYNKVVQASRKFACHKANKVSCQVKNCQGNVTHYRNNLNYSR